MDSWFSRIGHTIIGSLGHDRYNYIKSIRVFLFVCFGGSAGVCSQGFTLARQVFYLLNHAFSPIAFLEDWNFRTKLLLKDFFLCFFTPPPTRISINISFRKNWARAINCCNHYFKSEQIAVSILVDCKDVDFLHDSLLVVWIFCFLVFFITILSRMFVHYLVV